MTKHTLSENDLYQFTGTDHWYRHALEHFPIRLGVA